MTSQQRGYYGVTFANGDWRYPVRDHGLFLKGAGTYEIGEEALTFDRIGSSTLIVIPFSLVTGITISRWVGGRFVFTSRGMSFVWEIDGLPVASAFLLAGRNRTAEIAADLEKRIKGGGT